MGQISRQNRAARFVAEFEKDVVAGVAMTPGETWVYRGSHLSIEDGGCCEVSLVHRFTRDHRVLLLQEEVLFDPENQDGSDLAEDRFHDRLGVSEAEFGERLKRADL